MGSPAKNLYNYKLLHYTNFVTSITYRTLSAFHQFILFLKYKPVVFVEQVFKTSNDGYCLLREQQTLINSKTFWWLLYPNLWPEMSTTQSKQTYPPHAQVGPPS